MIEGREPNYICLDSRAAKLAQRLKEEERQKFYDGFYAAYKAKLSGNDIPCFPDDLVGDLLKLAAETMIDGFDTYMKRANANPTGKKPNDNPKGSQWVANDRQSNQDQSNQDKDNQDQINQIKGKLKTEGFTDFEIDTALSRMDGRTGIRNTVAYLRKAIQEERKTGKGASVRNYGQRDYDGEDEEAYNRMLESYRKEGMLDDADGKEAQK